MNIQIRKPVLVLDRPRPPIEPPRKLGFGDYCLKAECDIIDNKSGISVGRCVGYSVHNDITKRTQQACEVYTHRRSMYCSPVTLCILGHCNSLECDNTIRFHWE